MRKAAETLAAPIVTGADKTVLNGAYANVRLIYGENKNLENIEVSSETAELREALKRLTGILRLCQQTFCFHIKA